MLDPLRWLAPIVAAGLTASLGLAAPQDIYVNAVTGNDGNDGRTEATAFKTITRGLQGGGSGLLRRVIVAPGLYDSANGESFPLVVRRRRDIAGEPGAVVDAGGASVAISTTGRTQQPAQGVRGLEIFGAGIGLQATGGPVFGGSLRIHDCDVGIHAINTTASIVEAIAPIACTIERCRVGIEVEGRFRLSLQQTQIRDIAEDGVRMRLKRTTSTPAVYMTRSTILDCGASAFRFEIDPGLFARLQLMDSVIGASPVGILVPDSMQDARVLLSLNSATIVSSGVGVDLPDRATVTLQARYVVLAHNGLDVEPGGANVEFTDSLLEGGQYQGQPGVISGDPMFVDPAARDYRLRASSPAIDAALPAFYAYHPPTLTGTRCDGNQDAVLGIDFGAHAFETLRQDGPAVSGQSLDLGLHGEPGATGLLFRSLEIPQVPGFGVRTTSGLFELERSTTVVASSFAIPGAQSHTTVTVPISGDPALIGTRIWYQGVITSSASPTGRAFTNRALVWIVSP